jgi:hypothetical protein
LSYVGEPFDYDIFVSYAHAEVETKAPLIRDWSRHAAGRLQDLLATALNVDAGPGSEVQVFFDDRVLVSGQPVTQTLREKVQRSALLLVFMSPLYPKKGWCLDELEWFFQQANQDGRRQEHCTVLRIQPLREDAWPKRLRDERGRAVLFHDFVDPRTELLPLCLDNLGASQLSEALLEPFIELQRKLRSLRSQLEARRRLTVSIPQKPADRPVIYLDAAPDEEALWRNLKGELRDVAIVRPVNLTQANGDEDPLDRAQQRQRRRDFERSDGLVLLHSGRDSWLEDTVATSYFDRRLLWQRQRHLPWAILDRVGARPSVADDYDVPCVPATSGGWQRELLTALGLSSSNAEPAS